MDSINNLLTVTSVKPHIASNLKFSDELKMCTFPPSRSEYINSILIDEAQILGIVVTYM
jgi:hypothetical protein